LRLSKSLRVSHGNRLGTPYLLFGITIPLQDGHVLFPPLADGHVYSLDVQFGLLFLIFGFIRYFYIQLMARANAIA
jgi:hypothetical protein